MSIKYTMPKGSEDLNKMVTSAIRSARTMQDKVQQAAIGILFHAEAHGDYSYANVLIEGLGNAVKRDALVLFFVKYGGLSISEDKTSFDGWMGKDHIRANFSEAKSTMWYDLKQSNPFEGYSLEDQLQKLVKVAFKHKKALKKKVSTCTDEGERIKLESMYNFKINDGLITQLSSLVNFDLIEQLEQVVENDQLTEQEKATA